MSSPGKRLRRPAMIMLAACFFLSAISRVSDPDGALAYEVQRLTQGAKEETAVQAPTSAELLIVVDAVREREDQLNRRELGLAERSKIIEAAEAKLREQLIQLETAEQRLADLVRIADKASERDVGQLIDMYQAMGGKNAAPIFETMDASFAAGLLSRMEGEPASAILASISPEKAYEITVMIASQNARAPE